MEKYTPEQLRRTWDKLEDIKLLVVREKKSELTEAIEIAQTILMIEIMNRKKSK